jgi:hypothetical protein
MKKFWKAVNWLFDWFMNLLFAAIFIGGGAWCIKELLF